MKRGEIMKITPTTRNTMSRMISDIRLNTNVSRVSSVDAVEKIDTQNNKMSSTSGELLKETFYDTLERVEHRPSNQERNRISNNQDNRRQSSLYAVSKADEETLNFIKSMLEKFNKALDLAKNIDLARNQNEFLRIKNSIDEHSRTLSDFGIYTDKLSHFYIKEDVFVSEIFKNPQKIHQLLDSKNGIIRKLCDVFGDLLKY